MRVISLSAPKWPWVVVFVNAEGALTWNQVEQWALIEFGERDGPTKYARGQCVVPVVLTPTGLSPVIDPVGIPGSPYLGYEELGSGPFDWSKARDAYLATLNKTS